MPQEPNDHERALPRTAAVGRAGPGEASLTSRAAHGMAWMVLQTVLSKPLNLVGQLILATIIVPEQWGLIAMAFTPAVVADLIQQAGLREILLRRPRSMHHWVTPAFWLSLATGLAGTAFLLGGGPLAAWYYDAPPLVGLIMVLALAVPINALGVVPDAAISVALRFRELAAVNFVSNLTQMLLTLGLAVALPEHLDAYAFAWPYPAAALVRTAALWWLAPVRISRRARMRRWPGLLRDSIVLLAGSVLFWVANLAGIIVLGRTHDEEAVGALYFATLIASQTVAVLELNLLNVLMPSLAHLNDDLSRQRSAFLRAASAIALVGGPASLLIAVIADPLLRALFDSQWLAAIPMLQVIAAAMAFRPTTLASIALMKANGRFGAYTMLFACWASLHLGLAFAGAKMFENGPLGVACAMGVYYLLLGPVTLYVAIAPLGGTGLHVLRVHVVPIVSALLAACAAYGVTMLIPEGPLANWLRIAVAGAVMACVCLAIFMRFGGRSFVELLAIASKSVQKVPVAGAVAHRLHLVARKHAARAEMPEEFSAAP